MRGRWQLATAFPLAAVLLLGAIPVAAVVTSGHAAEPKVAVFDFELVDTSLEGATYGLRPDQEQRLARLAKDLRTRLAKSGRVQVVDIAAVAANAHAVNLRTCDGCDARLARQLGADYSIIGWVQKVSNLILNMNVEVRDANNGRVVAGGSVDMRGNTDETWSRALDWLYRYQLVAPRGPF